MCKMIWCVFVNMFFNTAYWSQDATTVALKLEIIITALKEDPLTSQKLQSYIRSSVCSSMWMVPWQQAKQSIFLKSASSQLPLEDLQVLPCQLENDASQSVMLLSCLKFTHHAGLLRGKAHAGKEACTLWLDPSQRQVRKRATLVRPSE